jgi:hypothetical protein
MVFILIYGADGTGKSIQAKSIAEAQESALHLSFATKNRKLYETSQVTSIELLRFFPDSTINPYQTTDAFHDEIAKIVKENKVKTLIIDEITLLRKWAQYVVLEDINRTRKASGKSPLSKIGKDNLAAWSKVNDTVYGELEHLANWGAIQDCNILVITAITEERRLITNSEGETSNEATGRWICDAKNNIRKLADVIVRLEKDGSKGRGYYAFVEKQQDWMTNCKDAIKIDKTGLLIDFMERNVIV